MGSNGLWAELAVRESMGNDAHTAMGRAAMDEGLHGLDSRQGRAAAWLPGTDCCQAHQ